MLKLSEDLNARIRAHAMETYPHECCGALLGRDGESGREVFDLVPVANRREDSPENRYAITPEDVRAAEHAARDRGMELLGWYHSHPDHSAEPSAYDREHAWPWYSYVIVGVTKREPKRMTAWRLADDRSRFLPEEIEVNARARV